MSIKYLLPIHPFQHFPPPSVRLNLTKSRCVAVWYSFELKNYRPMGASIRCILQLRLNASCMRPESTFSTCFASNTSVFRTRSHLLQLYDNHSTISHDESLISLFIVVSVDTSVTPVPTTRTAPTIYGATKNSFVKTSAPFTGHQGKVSDPNFS